MFAKKKREYLTGKEKAMLKSFWTLDVNIRARNIAKLLKLSLPTQRKRLDVLEKVILRFSVTTLSFVA